MAADDDKVVSPVEEPMPPDSLSPQLQRPDSTNVESAISQPAHIPSQPAEDILDAPSQGGQNEKDVRPNEEGHLVRKAQNFLQNPSIRDQPDGLKETFLLEKGLDSLVVEKLLSSQSGPLPPVPPRTYPKAPRPTSLAELIRTVARQFVRLFGVSASILLIYFQFVLPNLSYVLHARHELQAQRISHISQILTLISSIKASRRSGPSPLNASGADPMDREDEPSDVTETQVSNESKSAEYQEASQPRSIVALNQLQTGLMTLSTSIRELNGAKAQNQDRSATLHTLTNLTGYISSQIHIPATSFGSNGRLSKPVILGPVEEEVRREIRALKGLALNRRSFVGASSLSTVQG